MFNKALIIGILLVGATFSISANAVQKWEYMCVEMGTYRMTISQVFNDLGENGWEMVGGTSEDDTGTIFQCFKRKKN